MADHPEPPADENPAQLPPVLPRRNPATHRAAATTTNLTELTNFVKSVQALAGDHANLPEAPAENPTRRVKKFARSGNVDDRSPPKAAAEPAPTIPGPTGAMVQTPDEIQAEQTATNKSVAWPRLVKAEEPGDTPIAPRRPARPRRKNTLVYVAAQGFGFSLLAIGFWVGRQLQPSTRIKPAAVNPEAGQFPTADPTLRVSERAFEAANFALHATRSGDVASARQLFETVATRESPLPGTPYRLALLAWQGGDLIETERQLNRSIQAGENMAACSYIRARMAADQDDFTEAVRQLQVAAHAEPFDGRYLFYWGEALRRQGKPRSAEECLQQALDRPGRPEDLALYTFKRRLLQAENGNNESLAAEVVEGMRQKTGAGEWHLVAAALALVHSAFPTAADHLKAASTALPPDRYERLTRDYLFQEAVNQPALNALLSHPTTGHEENARPDPVSSGPEVADPALWPVHATR